MDGQHISTVLANADKEDTRKHSTQRICVGAGVFAILLLCWMFLEYQKTEYLDAVVAGVVGLAGGYGIGRATQD